METVTIIGLDLAKRSFQAHGAQADGSVAFRKKLRREKVLGFLAEQPRCVVAMEACGSAHHWGRAIRDAGHEVRLIPPAYVKPFVKRQKNDTADAEAIAEAASRSTMRFVAVKTQEQQARAMLFRTRDLLVRRRTQLINAPRGQLAEHGVVAPQGPANVAISRSGDRRCNFTSVARGRIGARIPRSDRRTFAESRGAREGDNVRSQAGRHDPSPADNAGRWAITAMAIEIFAPPMEVFRRGRDFAAWLGLVPVQHSTGGKQVLGKTSKMGQRDIRRLLISGAMVIVRWACRKGAREGTWLHRMLGRKPRMLVAIALANKMARAIWAMLTKGGGRAERPKDLRVALAQIDHRAADQPRPYARARRCGRGF